MKKGEITQAEFDEYAKTLGSDMYSERREQSDNWSEEQRKYFGMEADEYIAGLERQKDYTEEYYRWGMISRREYNEGMTELNHAIWDEAASAYDDMLKKQQDYISEMRDTFSKQEQALRDSWTVEDRKADIGEVSAQLDIYAGAVTDRGQQKYKELQEQMKQLQRDEELYNLQVRNNAVIEDLEADYKNAENMKSDFMKGIASHVDADVSGIISSINAYSQTSGNIENLLGQLLQKFDSFKVENNSMTDSRTITINNHQLTMEQWQEQMEWSVGL